VQLSSRSQAVENFFPAADRASRMPNSHTFMEFSIQDFGVGPAQVNVLPYLPANFLGMGYYSLWVGGSADISALTPMVTVFYDGSGDMPSLPFLTTATFGGADDFIQVRFSQSPTGPWVYSQIVHYNPTMRPPTVGIPDNFNIRNIQMRPQLQQPSQEINYNVGDLTFWADWHIASRSEIVRMLERSMQDANPGTADHIIQIEYTISRIDRPELDFVSEYWEYITVPIQIRVSGGALSVTNPHTTPLYIRYLPPIIHTTAAAGTHPVPPITILNAAEDPGDLSSGWQLIPHAATSITASINVETVAVHRDHNFPTLNGFFAPLTFPNIHHMIVEATQWMDVSPAGVGLPATAREIARDEDGRPIWRSQSTSFTLDDLVEPFPPAPINLTTWIPDEGTTSGPALGVRFNISITELNRYLNQMHQFTPYVTTSLYIGAFEHNMRRDFIDNPDHMTAQERENNTVNVVFDPSQPGMSDGRLDFSLITVTRNGATFTLTEVLRGIPGVPSVVRIENLPVMQGTPLRQPNGDFPATVPGGTIVSIPPTNPTIEFIIEGLDENRRYYMFADLMVVPYTEIEGSDPVVLQRGIPVMSPFSVLVGETTHGTVYVPRPDDVEPPAPTGLGAESTTQISTTVFWTPVPPVPGTVIHYEIIRVREGYPMTAAMMQGLNDRTLWQVLTLMREGGSDVMAWRGEGGTPQDPNIVWIPTATGLVAATSNDNVAYRHSDVQSVRAEFDDLNLLPNQVFFYYVRTVQIIVSNDVDVPDRETRSSWVEVPVTTPPVGAPFRLRQIDGSQRFGYDPQTMAFLAWDVFLAGEFGATNAAAIIQQLIDDYMGDVFAFEYRIREVGGTWSDASRLNINQLRNASNISINADGSFTFRYMYSGLRPGRTFEMQVRLVDAVSNDSSMWSNTVVISTEQDDDDRALDRDTDDWLEYLRGRLEDLLRQPFWFAQNTPTRTIMVYRPAEIFAGLLHAPGNTIPLSNLDVNSTTIYLPISVITDANYNRRGFSTRYSDLDILFAPSFINPDHNQAIMDMTRALETRGSNLTDYFVRMDIERHPFTEINGVPSIGRQTDINLTLVATNRRFSNIRSWDLNVYNGASRIVNQRLADPVLRQNVRNMLERGTSREDMVIFMDTIETQVSNQITGLVDGYMNTRANGILTNTTFPVTQFNAGMNVVSRTATDDMSLNAHSLRLGQWVSQPLIEFYNGRGFTVNAPGTFAFTGRAVNIPGINEAAQGGAMTSIVARFGLQDLFGLTVDLEQNANRHMVVGSIARMAGAPQGSDPMTWAANNLNVTMTSRNGDALIPRQEAIAMVMALYEHATNTRVSSINIRNFQTTAGMTLDNRFAQAVRAAFEIGIVTDTEMNPAGAVSIGEFLDMLASLGSLVDF